MRHTQKTAVNRKEKMKRRGSGSVQSIQPCDVSSAGWQVGRLAGWQVVNRKEEEKQKTSVEQKRKRKSCKWKRKSSDEKQRRAEVKRR